MKNRNNERPSSIEDLPPVAKAKVFLRSASYSLRLKLNERVEYSKSLTGALRSDTTRFELESTLTEIKMLEYCISECEALILLLP